jgi:hypothetical protein
MTLEERLTGIFEARRHELPVHAWPSEAARWAELVFSVLQRLHGGDPEVTRQSVTIFLATGLLEVPTLAALNPEAATTCRYVLASHGWREDEITKAIQVLQAMAKVIQKRYRGKLQSIVRRHASEMRKELTVALRVPGLSRADLTFALGHWMQNAFSLPVSLESDALRAFCREEGVTPRELVRAADSLELNVALLDDLLEAHAARTTAPAKPVRVRAKR